MDGVIACRVHHEPVLCVDKAYAGDKWMNSVSAATLTFFVPNPLMRAMLPASPRQALWRLRLPWGKGEIEEMVQ